MFQWLALCYWLGWPPFRRAERAAHRPVQTPAWLAVTVTVIAAGAVLTVAAYVALRLALGLPAAAGAAWAGGIVIATLLGLLGQSRLHLDRLRRRHEAGRCVRCGYDLRGNPATHCPECGTPCVAHRARPPTMR